MARRRSGTKFDPELADLFCTRASEILSAIDAEDVWQAVVDEAPNPEPPMTEVELERALEAVADFVDVKSPYGAGHSRGVAALAAAAAGHIGLPAAEIVKLRRSALVHDLGRMGGLEPGLGEGRSAHVSGVGASAAACLSNGADA